MAILYEDQHVVCDDDALTIKRYHFPIGSKRIPYQDIKSVEEVPLDWLTGKLRIWGMGPAPYWFHLDWSRPNKDRGLVLDYGSWLKSVVTPNDLPKVLEILRDHVRPISAAS